MTCDEHSRLEWLSLLWHVLSIYLGSEWRKSVHKQKPFRQAKTASELIFNYGNSCDLQKVAYGLQC